LSGERYQARYAQATQMMTVLAAVTKSLAPIAKSESQPGGCPDADVR